MRQLFAFYLIALVVSGCQIEALKPDTVVPDMKARIARRIHYPSPTDASVWGEDAYTYNAAGHLERVDYHVKTRQGTSTRSSYRSYEHGIDGRLSRIIYMGNSGNGTAFKPIIIYDYTYPSPDKTVETITSVYTSPAQSAVTRRVETFTRNGVIERVDSYEAFQGPQLTLASRKVLTYQAGRLMTEEVTDATGRFLSRNQYSYNGRKAQVETTSATLKQPLLTQMLEYDYRGRLTRQVLINNSYNSLGASIPILVPAGSENKFEYLD